jgi:hypothetical protein
MSKVNDELDESIKAGVQTVDSVVIITYSHVYEYNGTNGNRKKRIRHNFAQMNTGTNIVSRRAIQLASGLILFATTDYLFTINLKADTFNSHTGADTIGITRVKKFDGLMYYLKGGSEIRVYDGSATTDINLGTGLNSIVDFDFHVNGSKNY